MTPPQRYHTRPGLTASRVRALLGGLSWLAGVSVAVPLRSIQLGAKLCCYWPRWRCCLSGYIWLR